MYANWKIFVNIQIENELNFHISPKCTTEPRIDSTYSLCFSYFVKHELHIFHTHFLAESLRWIFFWIWALSWRAKPWWRLSSPPLDAIWRWNPDPLTLDLPLQLIRNLNNWNKWSNALSLFLSAGIGGAAEWGDVGETFAICALLVEDSRIRLPRRRIA